MVAKPAIVDSAAHAEFTELARASGIDPNDLWTGGYVDKVWTMTAPLYEAYVPEIRGKRVLEFGCNVGATAIMLAHLGAMVDAVDISAKWLGLARANAGRYGATAIAFRQIAPGEQLPFDAARFDLVSCSSVLEYVAPALLAPTLAELDRVLKPGGVLLSCGTSSRLWPREVHSRRWFSNYMPRLLDRVLGSRQRGVFPWEIRPKGYRDLVAEDPARYLGARFATTSAPKRTLLRIGTTIVGPLGLSIGMLTPSIAMVMKKPL